MRWSWTVARIAGISVDVHATFLILLAWIALANYQVAHSTAAALAGVLLTLTIFASVLLHEFGHALTAARFGVKTRSITLLPIGGVARLERIPDQPRQELMIALAGPAVTAAIVILLYAGLRATGTPVVTPAPRSFTAGAFTAQVMWINFVLLVFNLLPAFPMDGGRVLRAVLAMRMPFGRATQVAARVGKAFAVVFALVGLFVFNNPFFVLIGAFVWLGAAAESAAAQMKTTIGDVRVSGAMITDIRTLSPGARVSAAVDEIRTGFQHDFPVVDDHQVVGVLTRENVLKALTEDRGGATVSDVMQRDFASMSPEEPLDRALQRLQQCHCRTLPVLQNGELVGLLTAEKIGEFVMIRSAEQSGHGSA